MLAGVHLAGWKDFLENLQMEGAKVQEGVLESSLIQIIQEHQQRAFCFRDQADKAKKDALKDAIQVSELLVDTVNGGVEEAFINEKHVELEIRSLISTITQYRKQTNQWLAASHSLNNSLKEIGDFENWMKTMDFDCKSINAAIRNIHQA
ncbi:Biogenesis of lysosome-related organelles complex 1 subunit 1 [Platanthera guangdongensis]|uniref:Biogenesis of lysosome-related organelles complex 1 subunit 1 n=1 Tax=Platanthera guangdongensis TaxID=2320717 RepID=A0ABR2N3C6_9ASPA